MKKSIDDKKDWENMNPSVDKKTSEKINKILTSDLPKETKKNHVSVGGVGSKFDDSFSFYNPHNARFYYKFSKNNFSVEGTGGVGSLKLINTSELCNPSFFNCRVVVKKNFIEITNQVDKERIFTIDGNAKNRRLQVVKAVAVLERECVDVLKKFIVSYGGFSDLECVKFWIPDNKIYDKFIDENIPLKQTFRNDVVKKVYLEKPNNVEYSDPSFSANALMNMGLYDYAPEIALELNKLNIFYNPVRFLKDCLKDKLDICNYPDIVNVLSADERLDIENFIFEKFGGKV